MIFFNSHKKTFTLFVSFLLIFLITGCSSSKKQVTIGTKPMTEQFILAEMLALLIEKNTDLEVKIVKGIAGGTGNIQPAMVKGEIDLYPEYTGTAWSYVLKRDPLADSDQLFKELRAEYKKQFNFRWLGLYGFNNTYALAMKESLATEHNLTTYSDLARQSSQFVFGAEYDFYERKDGFDGLVAVYGFNFSRVVDLDIGLKYQAIESGKVDVINAFTTDGLLTAYNMKVLQDDKNFFPSYYCGTAIRQETLDKYPQLEAALVKLNNQISESEMSYMNYQVESEKKNEREVAENFLKNKKLL